MERGEHIFRTAVVGGFNRQDVLDYIEAATRENREKAAALQKELQALRAERETLRQEKTALEQQAEALRKETDKLRKTGTDRGAELGQVQAELVREREQREALQRELDGYKAQCARWEGLRRPEGPHRHHRAGGPAAGPCHRERRRGEGQEAAHRGRADPLQGAGGLRPPAGGRGRHHHPRQRGAGPGGQGPGAGPVRVRRARRLSGKAAPVLPGGVPEGARAHPPGGEMRSRPIRSGSPIRHPAGARRGGGLSVSEKGLARQDNGISPTGWG